MISFPQLYQQGTIISQVTEISPKLASWDHKQHPSQIRLHAYLDDLFAKVDPLPKEGYYFLDLRIDVGDPKKLVRHHDVENYLTPLFGTSWFDYRKFPLVCGSKNVGKGSRLIIGEAILVDSSWLDDSWCHISTNAGKTPTEKSWKLRLNEFIESSGVDRISDGQPVEFHMAWRCSTRRNWVGLWKPTGDALSPILGYIGKNSFNPNDDRITALNFHRIDDDTVGNDVHVGLWWKTIRTD
jgi:hypothetical protein